MYDTRYDTRVNLNKVFLIGRLTQDPEVRSTQSGQSVTTLNLATNRVWNNSSGEKQEATEFHRVVAWGRLGEVAGQYLKKGGLAMIEGRLQTRSWTDQNNNKRYSTEIVAEGLQLGPRPAGGGSSFGGGDTRPAAVVSDVKKPASPVKDENIPIIGEDEPTSFGVEEEEKKIKAEDLPF